MSIRKCAWQIAIRKRCGQLLFDNGGTARSFKLVKNTPRYWCADPFLIDFNDKKYLFFEMYDRLKRKGTIGYREIKRGGTLGSIRKAYECPAHLSYPFPFVHDGKLYVIPESNNLNKLVLLQAEFVRSKLILRQVDTIMSGVALADATFLNENGETFMFATPVSGKDNVGTLEMYTLNGNEWVSSSQNPLIEDKSIARMAGKFIKSDDGKTIRCSQYCQDTYGGGLNFSTVDNLNGDYSESLFLRILPNDVNIESGKQYDGIHTYNYDGEYEVIDLKRNRVFSIVECVGYLLQKLHITKKQTRSDG